MQKRASCNNERMACEQHHTPATRHLIKCWVTKTHWHWKRETEIKCQTCNCVCVIISVCLWGVVFWIQACNFFCAFLRRDYIATWQKNKKIIKKSFLSPSVMQKILSPLDHHSKKSKKAHLSYIFRSSLSLVFCTFYFL